MAYDDIRISELPSLPSIHNNDLFLIQDVTNNLAHRLDWGRLKNSIGTLSKGITFPLGTVETPEIAVGDYTSGIMAEDYGTFVIVTHGQKRIKVNQAGTIELINGNVVIGNYDRQCFYTLIINNLTTFNCYVKFGDDVGIDGNLDVGGNITGGKNLTVAGDVTLGSSCDDTLVINSQILAYCDMDLQGTMSIHTNLNVDKNATILGDVILGTNCENKLDVYSDAWFRCDLRVDGDLSFGGDLMLEGDVTIGSNCDNKINLIGETTVWCDFRVKGNSYLEQDLSVLGSANIDANLNVAQDTYFGSGCLNTTTIDGQLVVECNSFFRGDIVIGDDSLACDGSRLKVEGVVETKCDIIGHKDLIIDHNTTLGDDCYDDLLVKSSPVFQCDAKFEESVNITEDVFIGGNLNTHSLQVDLGDPNTGCVNPNLIWMHGEVHIDCNLFVSGNVFYDGDLEITGPDISFGSGCGFTVINLKGHTHAHCDMYIEGTPVPDGVLPINHYALVVNRDAEVRGRLDCRDTLNVALDSAHDANLFVHLDTYLNLPPPAHRYWEQCECIDEGIAGFPNRDKDQATFINGTQHSLCQVYLNDPRWYKDCQGDLAILTNGQAGTKPHVQSTTVYGHFNTRSNVDLNSSVKDEPKINHGQRTSIWAKLHQYSQVELNKGVTRKLLPTSLTQECGYDPNKHDTVDINFNKENSIALNQEATIIHGDVSCKASLILNTDPLQITQVMGKLQTQWDVWLNGNFNGTPGPNADDKWKPVAGIGNHTDGENRWTKILGNQESFQNVYLNGQEGSYPDLTWKDCTKKTIIWGELYSSCNVTFGNPKAGHHCEHTTTLHSHLDQDAKVQLNLDATCAAPSVRSFNEINNERSTIIYGDTDIKASVILNRTPADLTQIKGKLQTQDDVYLNGIFTPGVGNNDNNLGKLTKIQGTQESFGNVYLNGQAGPWDLSNSSTNYKDCGKETLIWGELKAACNVYFGNPNNGCETTTTLHSHLLQDATVELNKNAICCPVTGLSFNSTANKGHTTVHGDYYSDANVELNKSDSYLTRINGVLDARADARLIKNVHLNGGSGNPSPGVNTEQCGLFTHIHGELITDCNVDLNTGCTNNTNIHGVTNMLCDANVTGKLDVGGSTTLGSDGCSASTIITMNGPTHFIGGIGTGDITGITGITYGNASVTQGQAGFLVSGGSQCAPPTWQKAVTKLTGLATQSFSSPIDISVSNINGHGDSVVSGTAGDGVLTISLNGISQGTFSANQKNNIPIDLQVPPPAACPDGGLEWDDVQECMRMSDTACPNWRDLNLLVNKVYTNEPGTIENPAIVLGVKDIVDSTKFWNGLCSNAAAGAIMSYCTSGGTPSGGNCAPDVSGSTRQRVFSFSNGNNPATDASPHVMTGGMVDSHNDQDAVMVCYTWTDGHHQEHNGAPKKYGNTKFAFDKDQGSYKGGVDSAGVAVATTLGTEAEQLYGIPSGYELLVPSGDTRISGFTVDDALDAFGGFADDPDVDNGVVRWVNKQVAHTENDPLYFPFACVSARELAARLPLFTNWTLKGSAWNPSVEYDEDGSETWDYHVKENLTIADLEPGRLNTTGLHGLALAGLARHKKKLDTVENKLEQVVRAEGTTELGINAPATFGDVVKIDLASLTDAADDTAAAAAGVEVSQVYRNGSQLMIRVS